MARVIRTPDARTQNIPRGVWDAKERATHILQHAEAEASRIVDAAKKEQELLRTKTLSAIEAEVRAEFSEILAGAIALREQAVKNAEPEIVQIVSAAVRRIVAEELALKPEHIVAIVRQLVERSTRARRVAVRVNPEDAPFIESIKREVQLSCELRIEADASMERGGCIIETDLGDLDARLGTQLDALDQALVASNRTR